MKQRKGGKFLYSGAYGCSFKPALRCTGSNTRKNGYISKIINSDEGAKEWNVASTVRGLNRGFNYFVYPDEQCSPAKANASDEVHKCSLKYKNPILLQSPYGGVDLQHIVVPNEDIPAFFQGFLNIFDGVALLHKNKYVHKDIKLPNIVGLKQTDGTYLLRLIDFGLSRQFSQVMNDPDVENYAYWPYDMRFLKDEFLPSQQDIDAFLEGSKYFFFPEWFFDDVKQRPILSIKYGLDLMKKIREGGETAKETMIKGSDVYAVGRALYESYILHTGYISTAKGECEKLPEAAQMPDMPKEATLALHALVHKMCNPDPFARATLEEARAEFLLVLKTLKGSANLAMR